MAEDAQLAWERRAGRPAAAAAFASAALTMVAVAVQAPATRDAPGRNDPDRHRQTLLSFEKHASNLLASSVAQGLALALLGGVLLYLYRASRHRRPELPSWVAPLVIGAPLLAAAAALVNHFDLKHLADQFTSSGHMNEKRAKHLLDNRNGLATGLGIAGGLGVALSLVLTNVNAMRVGLVSRFVGIVGVILGALQVLQLLPQFVLQIFWLGAVGLLFLDIWPGGRGPAWDSGEALPWPTAADRAREREPEPEVSDPAPEPEPPRRASRKRKRRRGR